MTACIMCDKPAIMRLTWVNSEGSGVGGGCQGGPMCEPCASRMDDALSRFPMARETFTIWPLAAVAK